METDSQHFMSGFGSCDRFVKAMYEPDYSIANEIAVVVDGSGQFSPFKCKAQFGCVLHEVIV